MQISVNASDSGSGLHNTAYSYNNNEYVSDSTFVVTQNSTVEIKVRDVLENEANVSVTVDIIDKTAPTLKLTRTPSAWTKGSCTITAVAFDSGSGLHELPYSWDMGETWGSEAAMTTEEPGTYTCWVRDQAGNIEKKSIQVKKSSSSSTPPPAVTPSEKPSEKPTESTSELQSEQPKESEKSSEKRSEKASEKVSEKVSEKTTEAKTSEIKEDSELESSEKHVVVPKERRQKTKVVSSPKRLRRPRNQRVYHQS